MNDFIYDESPLPRDPGGMIEKIINIIGTVVDWFGNIAKKTGETGKEHGICFRILL